MNKLEKIQLINQSVQNTMTSTIGIEITDLGAPFKWVIGSHKITKEYINHWKNSKSFDELQDIKYGNNWGSTISLVISNLDNL